ncbi:MAG: hypothetical protein H6809_00330 [Phycisphaeraceae bacterium]|nr:hypothetical protein [Phycisphaeraceae bacterium]
MAVTGTAYETGRPTGVCAATGRPLEVGERFVAVLVEPTAGAGGGPAGLERLDFSVAAWDDGRRPEGEVFAFWRSVVAAPGAKKRQLVDDAALVDLFEQLEGASEARKVAFRYLLALVLVRKRLLHMEGTRTLDGASVLLVRPKGVAVPPERGGDGPALVEVVDPGLDARAMEEGTEELSAILLGDEGGR